MLTAEDTVARAKAAGAAGAATLDRASTEHWGVDTVMLFILNETILFLFPVSD